MIRGKERGTEGTIPTLAPLAPWTALRCLYFAYRSISDSSSQPGEAYDSA